MQKKIIIADDDPGVRDIFKIIFEKAGYATTIYPNGTRIMNNNYPLPDIFLLDKQLSGSDGLEICRYLKSREETRYIPVIIISATPGILELAKKAGADGCLEKPFVTRHLLEKISHAIQGAEMVQRQRDETLSLTLKNGQHL